MSISLKLLFEEIHQAKDEEGLRSHVAPKIGEYFAAKRSAIFFFEQHLTSDRSLQKVLRIALSTEHNPVVRSVRTNTVLACALKRGYFVDNSKYPSFYTSFQQLVKSFEQ